MAFILRRRSASILKVILILTAIWFTIAFLIYTDESRSGDSKWNDAYAAIRNSGIAYNLDNNQIADSMDANQQQKESPAAESQLLKAAGAAVGYAKSNIGINEADSPASAFNKPLRHMGAALKGGARGPSIASGITGPPPPELPKEVEEDEGVLNAPLVADASEYGQMGKAVTLPTNMSKEMKKAVDDGWSKNAFNQYASDLISVRRMLPDPRDAWCKEPGRYLENLPVTDVIICFHNEAWTVLLRTVHSVLDRTPAHLIGKVYLVDDYSDMPHTKKQLEDYFAAYKKVQILRATKREGLIRARLLGARHAISPVLTYLDSHCECTEGWLEPLLDRIARNWTTVVCPVIDVIDDTTMEYHFRDSGGVNVGGFDWNLQFNWHGVPERERKRHKVTQW